MASLRKTRGVDTSMGEITDSERQRAQWGAQQALRVLDCFFPEVSLDDGNSVEEFKCNKKQEYNSDTLARRAKDYFQDIYDKNLNGISIIPDIEDFCMFCGITRGKFQQICSSHDIQLQICGNNIRNAIAACKKQMAFNGSIPPVVFAIDFNNNHDYIQAKNQVEIRTSYDAEIEDSINDIASRLPVEE